MDVAALVLSLSVVLQLLAAGLAARLIRTTGFRPSWLLIAAALLMMTGRRAISLVEALRGSHQAELSTELVALVISMALVAGVAAIRPLFLQYQRAEEELVRTRGELSEVLASAPDGLALLREGRCVYANRALVNTLGFSSGDALRDRLLSDLAHFDDRAALARAVASPGLPTEPVTVRMGNAATPRWMEVVPGPELVFEGMQARVVLLSDVTERRRLEQQVREAQKMEAVGRLAGGVAHDFNNLLTVILGSTHVLRDGVADGSPEADDLDAVLEAARRASALTAQLLVFARHPVSERERFDLNDLVASTAEMLGRVLGEHVQAEFRTGPGPLLVVGDRGQLEQVFVNLVLNARDAMPEGGRLLVETSVLDLDPEAFALPSDAPRGPYAVLMVTDAGVGMTPEVRSRIFEPFFTTKDPGKGTGLGLATSYGIVRGLGGYISVRSAPGEGSTFRVYLPIAAGTPKSRPEPPVPPRVEPGHERILVVEDEPLLRDVAARALRERGYVVEVASNAQEALALLEESEPPDLLLTDVIMPGMNGRELARRVTEAHPRVAVLYMSGYAADVLPAGIEEEDVDLLVKPYTPDELCRRVRSRLTGSGPWDG